MRLFLVTAGTSGWLIEATSKAAARTQFLEAWETGRQPGLIRPEADEVKVRPVDEVEAARLVDA